MQTTTRTTTNKQTVGEGLAQMALTLAINTNDWVGGVEPIHLLQHESRTTSVRGFRICGQNQSEDISHLEHEQWSQSLRVEICGYGHRLLRGEILRVSIEVCAEIRLFRLDSEHPWSLHYVTFMYQNLASKNAEVFLALDFADPEQKRKLHEPRRIMKDHSRSATEFNESSNALMRHYMSSYQLDHAVKSL